MSKQIALAAAFEHTIPFDETGWTTAEVVIRPATLWLRAVKVWDVYDEDGEFLQSCARKPVAIVVETGEEVICVILGEEFIRREVRQWIKTEDGRYDGLMYQLMGHPNEEIRKLAAPIPTRPSGRVALPIMPNVDARCDCGQAWPTYGPMMPRRVAQTVALRWAAYYGALAKHLSGEAPGPLDAFTGSLSDPPTHYLDVSAWAENQASMYPDDSVVMGVYDVCLEAECNTAEWMMTLDPVVRASTQEVTIKRMAASYLDNLTWSMPEDSPVLQALLGWRTANGTLNWWRQWQA